MGLNPLHFEGVYVNSPTTCEQPWFQYAWQDSDRVSREDVAFAIAQAEADLERYLGFHLLPTWEVDEWQMTTRAFRTDLVNLPSRDIRGFGQVARADWGYFISGGIQSKTLLEAGSGITYSDVDDDNYDETATVTVAVPAGTSPCEIHVFYPDKSGSDFWEIRPISVSVVGAVATITFKREMAVIEAHLEQMIFSADEDDFQAVDGTDDDKFLEEVDVYRVWNNPQQQATMLWEPYATGCSYCTDDVCEHCAYSSQTGCLMLRSDRRNSMISFRPATWNSDDSVFEFSGLSLNRQPDLVRLYYYSGWRDMTLDCPNIQMDPFFERVVAYLAAAKLERPICECNNVRAFVEHWQMDLAHQPAEGSFKLSSENLQCPWGTSRGAIYAWQQIRRTNLPIGKAVVGI